MAIAVTSVSKPQLWESWLIRVALIVGGSLAFYAVVEAPSHGLRGRARAN
jgi:hypothetical protein